VTASPGRAGLDWLVDDLVNRLPGVSRAIILSSDGMLIGRSSNLHRDDAEHLAAVASGLQSLARGVSRHFESGAVRQTLVEMERTFLILATAGASACLAVLAEADVDLGLLAYEMNLLVKRVGTYVNPKPRQVGEMTEAESKSSGGSQ
jgi:predicted regulator of Ras-like GTPase activity (Roadblock/LC7/MglB family)